MAVKIQWHRVFDEALRRADVVAVARVAAMYLDRSPTRSELSAVRRAARSCARASNAHVLHVTGTTSTRTSRNILLIARADADLDNSERLHAIASGRIATPVRRKPGPGGPQVTDSLVGRVARAARQAQMADAGQLDPEHARALAQDLTEALGAIPSTPRPTPPTRSSVAERAPLDRSLHRDSSEVTEGPISVCLSCVRVRRHPQRPRRSKRCPARRTKCLGGISAAEAYGAGCR